MRILLVDDEKNILKTLSVTLKAWGHDVMGAASLDEALRALKDGKFDFVLTDFKLDHKSGIDLLIEARRVAPAPWVIVMTAFASFENAVTAIKEGAFDYLPKPFTNAQLEMALKKIQALVDLRNENERLKSSQYRQDFFAGQTSAAMIRLEEFMRKIASTDANVLITGESGTGKTELSRLIHARSPRASRSFVVVNCTSLSENLIESELFGHSRGAFTGAVQDHVGKLEFANHGTVLIDEIGELSPNGQTKLLRFLQEKVIERVGSNKAIQLDVRIVAATHRNLEEAVKDGKFREDLYYRLNVFECSLVPLRYRREDVPVLIQRFFNESLARSSKLEQKNIPDDVMKILLDCPWSGNIRELRNVMERVVLLSQGREIRVDDLPDSIKTPRTGKSGSEEKVFRKLEDVEREQIERVLAIESNQERAAEILGITTVTLWRKRKQFGLP